MPFILLFDFDFVFKYKKFDFGAYMYYILRMIRNGQMIIKTVFLSTFIVVGVLASTMGMRSYSCPACGEKFESSTQFSYSIFGKNLDTRPTGPAMIPDPIHKCPNCNFVFRNERSFTVEEVAKIKKALETNDIFNKEPGMPKYYYLARESEIINKNLNYLIYYFLSAVWENRDPDRKNRLINTTIEYIDKLNETAEDYNDCQLIKLDLLRRSGQFDAAMKLIGRIKENKNFYNGYVVKIIDLQVKLIKDKNREEHPLPASAD